MAYIGSPAAPTIATVSDGTVTSAKLADDAVTSAKITDGAVTPTDLSTGHPNWDSSGNVGIDKTPDSWASNYVGLQIGNTASIYGRSDTTNVIGVASNVYYDGTSNKYIQNGNAERMYFNSGNIVFENAGSGTAGNSVTFSERMRIDSSGVVLVGATSTGSWSGTNPNIACKSSVANQQCFTAWNAATSGTRYFGYFGVGSTFSSVGSISSNGSSTAYNTTSDYRLKENVVEVTDGISRVKLLKPSRFNFIVDPDKTVDGFLAHEVQDVVPEAITGTKDEVDADGNPKYQGIDQSKLVPLLTAALQEAITKIESLEARVATLESA